MCVSCPNIPTDNTSTRRVESPNTGAATPTQPFTPTSATNRLQTTSSLIRRVASAGSTLSDTDLGIVLGSSIGLILVVISTCVMIVALLRVVKMYDPRSSRKSSTLPPYSDTLTEIEEGNKGHVFASLFRKIAGLPVRAGAKPAHNRRHSIAQATMKERSAGGPKQKHRRRHSSALESIHMKSRTVAKEDKPPPRRRSSALEAHTKVYGSQDQFRRHSSAIDTGAKKRAVPHSRSPHRAHRKGRHEAGSDDSQTSERSKRRGKRGLQQHSLKQHEAEKHHSRRLSVVADGSHRYSRRHSSAVEGVKKPSRSPRRRKVASEPEKQSKERSHTTDSKPTHKAVHGTRRHSSQPKPTRDDTKRHGRRRLSALRHDIEASAEVVPGKVVKHSRRSSSQVSERHQSSPRKMSDGKDTSVPLGVVQKHRGSRLSSVDEHDKRMPTRRQKRELSTEMGNIRRYRGHRHQSLADDLPQGTTKKYHRHRLSADKRVQSDTKRHHRRRSYEHESAATEPIKHTRQSSADGGARHHSSTDKAHRRRRSSADSPLGGHHRRQSSSSEGGLRDDIKKHHRHSSSADRSGAHRSSGDRIASKVSQDGKHHRRQSSADDTPRSDVREHRRQRPSADEHHRHKSPADESATRQHRRYRQSSSTEGTTQGATRTQDATRKHHRHLQSSLTEGTTQSANSSKHCSHQPSVEKNAPKDTSRRHHRHRQSSSSEGTTRKYHSHHVGKDAPASKHQRHHQSLTRDKTRDGISSKHHSRQSSADEAATSEHRKHHSRRRSVSDSTAPQDNKKHYRSDSPVVNGNQPPVAGESVDVAKSQDTQSSNDVNTAVSKIGTATERNLQDATSDSLPDKGFDIEIASVSERDIDGMREVVDDEPSLSGIVGSNNADDSEGHTTIEPGNEDHAEIAEYTAAISHTNESNRVSNIESVVANEDAKNVVNNEPSTSGAVGSSDVDDSKEQVTAKPGAKSAEDVAITSYSNESPADIVSSIEPIVVSENTSSTGAVVQQDHPSETNQGTDQFLVTTKCSDTSTADGDFFKMYADSKSVSEEVSISEHLQGYDSITSDMIVGSVADITPDSVRVSAVKGEDGKSLPGMTGDLLAAELPNEEKKDVTSDSSISHSDSSDMADAESHPLSKEHVTIVKEDDPNSAADDAIPSTHHSKEAIASVGTTMNTEILITHPSDQFVCDSNTSGEIHMQTSGIPHTCAPVREGEVDAPNKAHVDESSELKDDSMDYLSEKKTDKDDKVELSMKNKDMQIAANKMDELTEDSSMNVQPADGDGAGTDSARVPGSGDMPGITKNEERVPSITEEDTIYDKASIDGN